ACVEWSSFSCRVSPSDRERIAPHPMKQVAGRLIADGSAPMAVARRGSAVVSVGRQSPWTACVREPPDAAGGRRRRRALTSVFLVDTCVIRPYDEGFRKTGSVRRGGEATHVQSDYPYRFRARSCMCHAGGASADKRRDRTGGLH